MKLKVRDKPKIGGFGFYLFRAAWGGQGHILRSKWKEAFGFGLDSSSRSTCVLSVSVVIQLTLIVLLICATQTSYSTNILPPETALARLRVRRQIFRQSIPADRPLTGNVYAEHHGYPHPGRWHEQPQSIKPPNPNSGHHFENQNVILTDEDWKRYGSTLQHIDEMIYQLRLREQPHLFQQPHHQQQQQYQQPPQHLELDLVQHHPHPQSHPPSQHFSQQVPSNYGPLLPSAHHGPNIQYLPPAPHQPSPPQAAHPPPGPTGSFQPSYFPPPHPPHQQQNPPQHNFLENHPGVEYGQIQLVSGPSQVPPSASYGPPPSAPETEIVHHGTPNPVIPVVAHFHYTHHAGEVKGERTVKYLPGSHVTHGQPVPPSAPSPQYGAELHPQYGPPSGPAPVPKPSPQYGAELRPQYGAPSPVPQPSPQYGAELNLPQYDVLGPGDDIHSSGPGPTFYGPPPAPAPVHAPKPVNPKPIRHHHHHESSFHRFKGPFNIRRPKHFSSSTSYGNNGGYLPARRPVRYSLRTPGSYSWSVSY